MYEIETLRRLNKKAEERELKELNEVIRKLKARELGETKGD